MTIGLPSIVARYEQQAGMSTVKRIIVDREGMAAEFLATLRAAGRTVISVLRTDQYGGLESFTDIGSFVPLRVSKSGKVMRKARTGLHCTPAARPSRRVAAPACGLDP